MNIQSQYTEALKKFVQDHLQEDPALLLFKYQRKTAFDLKLAVQQISARQKVKSKLPSWVDNPHIIFPPTISLEQCSSEETAKFKSDLVSGERFLDLTTGFGIDAFYIGRQFKNVLCFENQENLAAIVHFNFKELGLNHFEVRHGDGVEYLYKTNEKFDLIYLDPARRGRQNEKLFRLTDCEPDVIKIWPLLKNTSNQLLIKTSPMLDIKAVFQDLPEIQHVWVLSVKNEVKEILLYWQKDASTTPATITAVNLSPGKKSIFEFEFEQEEHVEVEFGEVEKYLIEPFSAILKAGAFKLFAHQFQLKKLNANSHLYTSVQYPKDIPGRVFEILAPIKPDKKSVKSFFPSGKVNVITRNYAMKADELKKKFQLRDGGDDFLIGTKVEDKYKLYHCRLVSED